MSAFYLECYNCYVDDLAVKLLKRVLHHIQDVQVVVYKGLDLSFNYYPKKNLRKYVDIDLCVRRAEYFYVKKRIAEIPRILLIKHESRIANVIYGHALYIDLDTKMKIELHVSKNPSNFFRYILGTEYVDFFDNLFLVRLGKERYSSLSRHEYLYIVVRQFLKKVSMGGAFFNKDQLTGLFDDFMFIAIKMNRMEWEKTTHFFMRKIIFMRLHNYYAVRTWYLFIWFVFCYRSEVVPKYILRRIECRLSNVEISEIRQAVSKLQCKEWIDISMLLEKPDAGLWLFRVFISCIQPSFFPRREPVYVK